MATKALAKKDPLLPILSKILSGPVLREVHKLGHTPRLNGIFQEAAKGRFPPSTRLLQVMYDVYEQLQKSYRSDYVFRTEIAKTLFLSRHTPGETVLLPEFRAYRSKADLLMINGTSTVYEIKSELDNFDRLDSQLSDYLKVFDLVYVVTAENQIEKTLVRLPEKVGLISLQNDNSLYTYREATSNIDSINIEIIVDALRIGEIKKMTSFLCGTIPDVSNALMFKACRDLLLNCEPKDVHNVMVKLLKERVHYTPEDFKGVPFELVPACLESKVTPKQWRKLTCRLDILQVADFLEDPCTSTTLISERKNSK